MNHTPIKLTLYDPDTSEVAAEYSRIFVPWGILKKAVKMADMVGSTDITESDMDSMAAIVCEAFGNKFTVDQLNSGADVSEVMTAIQAIISRAGFGQNGGRDLPLSEKKKITGEAGKG